MSTGAPIRVLVVDDSAIMRRGIVNALSGDPQIEVVGTAGDPYEARDRVIALSPDVLTLDIEMPRMDGLTFLRILQQRRPMPVVMISSLTAAGSEATLAALEAGAVDVLVKPTCAAEFAEFARQLPVRIKGAATARLRSPAAASPAYTPAAVSPSGPAVPRFFDPYSLIVIGSSTGGTEALSRVLPRLPAPLPPICVVQHIPAHFSRVFAERLNQRSALEVREAVHGDDLRPGLALVAPGDFHLSVGWVRDHYRVALDQQPHVHHCRPSVDVLFESAARCPGARVLAILLTGMGADGARGMLQLKNHGAHTVAQDEASCVVYGMPRAAAELDAVRQVLPLDRIPEAILQWTTREAGAGASRSGSADPTFRSQR